MAVSIEQIRNDLKYATSVLDELSVDYMKNVTDYSDENELRRYLASINMATMLETKISSNDVLECIFFAAPDSDIYLTRFNSQISWNQKLGIDDFIKSNHEYENDAIDESWHIMEIGNVHYLMQTYSLKSINIGILIRISRFIQAIEKTTVQNNIQYMLTDTEGYILASGNSRIVEARTKLNNDHEIVSKFEKKFFIITLPVTGAPLRLSCIKYRADIYYGIDIVQSMMIIFGLLAVVVVIISIFYLKKFIINPVTKLVDATKEVEKGNLDYRISEDNTSSEFKTLMQSFNDMVKEIKSLKILSYEEKLEKQKAELKYLQMQIKPHFYLNAINTISSLSMQKKNNEIGKFIIALSNYLRYLFADNLSLVTVKNEIDHAVAYIKLQQIKFPHMVFYMAEVKKECADYLLPKFLVQTFIENIFKHAFNGEEMLSVFIKADLVEMDGERFAQIVIEDNGDGFNEKYIIGHVAENENIGINNIRKTLALTYGRDDLLSLSNIEEGGARVKVLIPENSIKRDSE